MSTRRAVHHRAVWAIAVVLIAADCALAQRWEPPADFTMWQFREVRNEFNRATFLDVFTARHTKAEPLYEEALRCVEVVTNRMSGFLGREGDRNVGRRDGRKAVKAGWDDPILLYALAYLQQNDADLARRAYEGMVEQGDPTHRQAFAALRLARLLDEDRATKAEARALYEQAVGLLVESIGAGAWDDMRLLWSSLTYDITDGLTRDLAERLVEGIAALPDADPWLVHMARGVLHTELAWDARGTGYAPAVTPEGWEGFFEELNQAYYHLTRAHEMAPDRPEAATYLIQVAMGGSTLPGQDERYWFDKAVAAQVDWKLAYDKLLWALRPRWSGSYEEMYAFGVECLETGRFDTMVPAFLIDALVDMAADDEDASFWADDRIYEHVAALAEGYRGQRMYDDTMSRYYWDTVAICFAHAAGRYDEARATLDRIRGRLHAPAMERLHADQTMLFEDIHAYTSAVGESLIDVETALENGNFDDAIELCRSALAAVPEPEKTRRRRSLDELRNGEINLHAYVKDLLVALETFRDFMAGGWVDLRFDENLSGWSTEHGSWKQVDERTVSGTAYKDGLLLLLDAPVGPRWALRGTYVFPETTERQRKHSAAVYMNARSGFGKPDWQAVGFHPKLDELIVQRRWFTDQRITDALDIEPTGTFLVEAWDGSAVITLDGEIVYAHELPGSNFWPGHQLGIGGLFWYQFNDLRFTGLSMRMLEERPTALPEEEPAPDWMRELMEEMQEDG
jgi:tetratricopeptide (TPR) repeat protein